MKFDPKTILSNVLSDLPERSRDVIISRFGIGKKDAETLEAIGQRYSITRERVRQIESDSLKSIKEKRTQGQFAELIGTLEGYVRENGGIMDEMALQRLFARDYFDVEVPREWEGMVTLLLSVGAQFKKAGASDFFPTRWFIEDGARSKQEKIASAVSEYFKKQSKIVSEEELIAFIKAVDPTISDKAALSYVTATNSIKSNVYGQWGLREWPEIRPRGVKDKAHLVMKQHGEPLHFTQVASKINETSFSERKALAQTVHNELIKDRRFVLVGRGMYALREWGYDEGTVKDIIADELKKKGPMGKDDIVKAVLARRFVKPSTVVLNLNQFRKTEEGKYTLA